jgi:hypothetical protein
MVGTDVQEREKTFRDQPCVFVDKGKGANAHQDDKASFEEFKGCDGPEYAPLAAVTVWLFSGVSHEYRQFAGYHERLPSPIQEGINTEGSFLPQ